MPPIAAWWYSRKLGDVPVSDVDRRAAEFETWIRDKSEVAPEVDDIARGAIERASTLEAKVAGVLGGLAVLTATIGGVAIATWTHATNWERAMLLVSAAYSLVALLASLTALRPRPMFELTLADLRGPANNSDPQPPTTTRLAALKLAYEEGNANRVIRLANLLQVASISSRNAVITGTAPLLGLAISHWAHYGH